MLYVLLSTLLQCVHSDLLSKARLVTISSCMERVDHCLELFTRQAGCKGTKE